MAISRNCFVLLFSKCKGPFNNLDLVKNFGSKRKNFSFWRSFFLTFLIEAYLSFQFSSEDLAPEEIQIKTSFLDGNKILFEKTYWLGYWWFGYHRKYTDLTIDLKEEGVLDYLRDG
ncbi:MAG TPA: hypothetical protein ENJ96_08205, partial [Thermodesulfatator atlanticus]|nr:hypothetical protein [Thermodesulfatator atlanticus]